MKIRKPRRRAFALERLEDRTVPTTFGIPWADPEHLTLSFAPDGTRIGHSASALDQYLAAQPGSADWKLEVLRAFQTWAVQIDANIGVTADSGWAFGAIGLSQADPRFGDIRVGAFGQGPDTLANNVPFQPAAGSWSGDVFLNTDRNVTIGGAVDLFSVFLNEAGNVFGLADVDDPASALHTDYAGIRTGLSASDIATIRSLYGGGRTPDAHEGNGGNNTRASATWLPTPLLNLSSVETVVRADITTGQDADFYAIRVPLGVQRLGVTLDARGTSLLIGAISIYDSRGNLVAATEADSPLDNDASLQIGTFLGGSTYYVKVEGAVDNVFGIGAYGLALDFNPVTGVVTDPLLDTVDDAELVDQIFSEIGLVSSEQASNGSFGSAIVLETPPGYNPDTRYEAVESIGGSADVDFYRFRSPDFYRPVMLATVGTLGSDDLDLQLTVFDANQQQVPARTYRNDDGTWSVEIEGATAASDYFLRVTGAGQSTGNYFVVIDAANASRSLETLCEGEVDASGSETALAVEKSSLFRFDLDLSGAASQAAGQVQLNVYDDNGRLVVAMQAEPGAIHTRYVWLELGDYRAEVFTTVSNGAALSFRVLVGALSDDVGPYEEDPTNDPIDDSSGGGGSADDEWDENDDDLVLNEPDPPADDPWEEDEVEETPGDSSGGSGDPADSGSSDPADPAAPVDGSSVSGEAPVGDEQPTDGAG